MIGQVVFTNMPNSDQAGPGMTHWAGRGIMQTRIGALKGEHMYQFTSHGHRDEQMLAFVTGESDVWEEMFESDMGGAMLRNAWPMPRKGCGVSGGAMFVRQSAIPSPAGHETFLIGILLRAPVTSIVERRMYSMNGDLSIDGRMMVLGDARICPEAEINGNNLGHLYREPIWGWGEEPVGIGSTMCPRLIADSEAYLDLLLNENRTPEEDADLKRRYHTEARWVVDHQDEDYKIYRSRMIERYGRRPLNCIETKSEIETHRARGMAVVREIKAEQDWRDAA